MRMMTWWALSGDRVQKSHWPLWSVRPPARARLSPVDLKGEAPGIPDGVGISMFAGDGGEPSQHWGARALLQEVGLAPLADVRCGLEKPEGPVSLGVDHALGDPLPVEVGHLLDQVVILQEQRALSSGRERELV